MKFILAFTLILFSNLLFASAKIDIVCNRLDNGSSACWLVNSDAHLMDINGNPIAFNNSSKDCTGARCVYEGYVHPTALRVGQNNFVFTISTATNDPKSYALQTFDFYFNKKKKGDQFTSERFGYRPDTQSQNIDLELIEIDPKLHKELEEAKAEYRRLYDPNYFEKIQTEENRIREQQKEIDQKIKEFEALLQGMQDKQFDQVDAETLAKMDITQNQIQILHERKEELTRLQLNNSSSVRISQTAIVNRYNTHRARARDYGAYIPPLPAPQKSEDKPGEDVSQFVNELISNLNSIIKDHASAIATKDMDKLESAIKQWQERLVLVNDLLQTSRDLNSVEKQILTNKTVEGYEILFKQGLTNDLWLKTNNVADTNRKFIDSLADQGSEEAKELKKNLNFTKLQPALIVKIDATLAKAEKLSNKIDAFKPKDNVSEEAKKIAKATLSVGLESINDSVLANNDEGLKDADDSISIGLQILDFGLDLVPVVSSVRPAFELFTGKNMVTQESLSTAEISMNAVEVIAGLTGFNLVTAVFSRSATLFKKIGKKVASPWAALDIRKAFPQVENMLSSFKKMVKGPFIQFADASHVNAYLSNKYPRFDAPSFKGKVMKRVSLAGEEFCRVFKKGTKNGKPINTKAPLGIFTFRCDDIYGKSLEAIKEMAAIPDPDKDEIIEYWVTKFQPDADLPIIEGLAAPQFEKPGNALQVFLDVTDPIILDKLRASLFEKRIENVFVGF